ncbi:MAG: CBS domain-containing protein [Pseudomonadota bacterium]
MLLSTILKEKGGEVLTVQDTATLAEAANLLDEKRIGAVVALNDDNEICGVLSERDIVRHFARRQSGALSMRVSEAMTRGVISAGPNDSIEKSLSLMTDRRIRHLPIITEGRLVGIVSIGDLVKWKIDSVLAEAEAMTAYIKSG